MTSVLRNLVDSLGIAAEAPSGSGPIEEIWLRAADRFAVRASWPHEDNGVEFLALLGGDGELPPFTGAEADAGWCADSFLDGQTRQLLAWHRPTGLLLVADRTPAQDLDAAHFADALAAFIDRLLMLEAMFLRDGESEDNLDVRTPEPADLPHLRP